MAWHMFFLMNFSLHIPNILMSQSMSWNLCVMMPSACWYLGIAHTNRKQLSRCSLLQAWHFNILFLGLNSQHFLCCIQQGESDTAYEKRRFLSMWKGVIILDGGEQRKCCSQRNGICVSREGGPDQRSLLIFISQKS